MLAFLVEYISHQLIVWICYTVHIVCVCVCVYPFYVCVFFKLILIVSLQLYSVKMDLLNLINKYFVLNELKQIYAYLYSY